MHTSDFDYKLPEELIAQYPADKRDTSRLFVIDRQTGNRLHTYFYEILNHLKEGDCLVLNNSKVFPARLLGSKEASGGKVEFLLQKRLKEEVWETMVKPGKRLKPGDEVLFSKEPLLKAKILEIAENANRIVRFEYEGIFMDTLNQVGKIPLPPYIKRENIDEDKDRYQTVYCKEEGSVAAPTAGLHFTEDLLAKAKQRGIRIAYLTLHVGIGTFRPVKSINIQDHRMHPEEYEIDAENAEIINQTRAAGGRIISVGTTSVRTLESVADASGYIRPCRGATEIFIYPGYRFKIVDGLITNFHLPQSTLLMLVSAFYDRDKMLAVYEEAISEKYRFFSYGDAMLIL